MGIKLGNTNISKMYLGSTEISKAYLGNTLVYQNAVQELLAVPSGFNWTPPFNIYKTGSVYSSDFEPTDFDFSATATSTWYFNAITGLDSNNGLTPFTPKKTIGTVMSNLNITPPANGAVFILQTDYVDLFSTSTVFANFSLVVKSDVPGVKRKWTKIVTDATVTTVSAPVYRASRNQMVGPLDLTNLDSFGKPKRMIQVGSGAACAATPGSFFQETNAVQFHLWDGRSPDSNVKYFRGGFVLGVDTSTARNYYFQDIEFWAGCDNAGGAVSFNSTGTPAHIVVANNCDFAYSAFGLQGWTGQNTTVNNARFYLKDCNAYGAARDGFNYHSAASNSNNRSPNVFEYNCTARLNGYTLPSGGDTPNNNGSSIHDGGKAVRINGIYTYNQNRNIHDVTNNTQAWMLGCVAGYSLNQASENDSIDFNCGANAGTDVVEFWMDGCSFVGNSLKKLRVNSGSTVRYRNMDFTGWDNQINGTLTTY